MKICCSCKEPKSLDSFNKNRSTKDGLQKQCNDCRTVTQIKYRADGKGKETSKRYRMTDKGRISTKKSQENYRKTEKYRQSWQKTNKKNRLSQAVSTRMRQSLHGCKYNRHWEDLVGYSLQDLKEHLESQFQEGMNWGNHGIKGWHIDHIRPVDSFDIKSYEDDDFQECWSLNNLQPLWWQDNLTKSNKYEI